MILTLEEAIAREEDIVADNERFCAVAPSEITAPAYHSATYHRQIAGWLKELAGRKTGKWEYHNLFRTCSACRKTTGEKDDFNDWIPDKYCPNCGAKMEVEDADSN